MNPVAGWYFLLVIHFQVTATVVGPFATEAFCKGFLSNIAETCAILNMEGQVVCE